MHKARPNTQNTIGPRSCRAKIPTPAAIMRAREAMITRRGPMRSSSTPRLTVATPAMRLATTANTTTCAGLNPNVPAAMTPPNAKTPTRPSRKIADAMRNFRVSGAVRASRRMVCHSARYAPSRLSRPRRPEDADCRVPTFAPVCLSRSTMRMGTMPTAYHAAVTSMDARMSRASAWVTPNSPTSGEMKANSRMSSRAMLPRYPEPQPNPEMRPTVLGVDTRLRSAL